MSENLTGLVKIIGITVLLIVLWIFLSIKVPETFLSSNNIENLLRRTALYGILGIGVAFVIISSGIDLSIGSLVCLCACLLALFLKVDYGPAETALIWEINPAEKTMTVSNDFEYQPGDYFWYFVDRRDNALLKISSVGKAQSANNKNVMTLTFETAPKTKFELGTESHGTLSRAYEMSSISGETKVTSERKFPTVAAKDKLKFVHLDSATRDRDVAGFSRESDSSLIELADPAKGFGSDYRIVPIKRTSFMSIPLAILSVLGISLLIGLLHGVLITKWKQQPFIVTLCGLLIYRGISRWLTNDETVGFIEYEDSLGAIATGRWVLWAGPGGDSFGIPYSFFFLLALTILAIIFLNFTIWGRYIMALGRNEEAARYSGINTNRMTILAYVVCAVLTGIGGILFALDSNSIPPSGFGNFFELYAIAAAVLGGCSLRGGEGSILGVVVGTALMQTLYNSIVLLKIPDTLEFTIIGAVILLGVLSDEVVRQIAAKWRKPDTA